MGSRRTSDKVGRPPGKISILGFQGNGPLRAIGMVQPDNDPQALIGQALIKIPFAACIAGIGPNLLGDQDPTLGLSPVF